MANSSSLAVKISNLAFRYPKASCDTLYIKQWQVSEGEHVFLQGESGSGKSTLLQLLAGLQLGSGTLHIAGVDLHQLSRSQRDIFRARHIGMVFQQFNLIPYLSALDNVILAAKLSGCDNKNTKSKAQTLLEKIGLPVHLVKQAAESLSIGQQQRVAIARALINKPPILLFDEPTSALDKSNQMLFMNILQDHLKHQPKTTVIFASHDTRLTSYFNRSDKLANISSPNKALKASHVQ